MNDDEYQTFQRLFKDYFRHTQHEKFQSLIARIYGVFTVYREKIHPIHLILMANTVNLKGNKLKYMFDLKGSLVNRKSKMKKKHKPSSTLKDLNLLKIKKKENIVRFSAEDRKQIMKIIKRDVSLLESCNIMDFSLLLAVEENYGY